ncbi:MAG: tetratricopeptide repeat protein [Planctomycetales bacterium]
MNNAEDSERARRWPLAATLLIGFGAVLVGLIAWFVMRPQPDRLLKRALAVAERDPVAAEGLLRRAIQVSRSGYPDAQLALCLVLVSRGQWEAALEQWREVDRDRCRADMLLAFGREALQAKHRSAARDILESLAERNAPQGAEALELLITEYYDCDQLHSAIDAARRLVRREPNNPDGWRQLGKLLKDVYREEEFVQTMRDAMSRDVSEDERREFAHRLVDALIANGDAAAAWQLVRELQRSEGDSTRVRGYEIDLYRLEGEPEQALAALNQIFSEIQMERSAYFTRGSIYLDLRRLEEAVRDLETAVARDPSNDFPRAALADALRRLGKTDEARRQREIAERIHAKRSRYDKLLRRRPADPHNREIYEELVGLARELQEPDAAEYFEERVNRLATGSGCPEARGGKEIVESKK